MNVLDLRNDLINVYQELRKGDLSIAEAKEAANVSGKVFSSAKLQLEYNKTIQAKRKIAFLDVEENSINIPLRFVEGLIFLLWKKKDVQNAKKLKILTSFLQTIV